MAAHDIAKLVSWRRQLHQHPELSGQEHNTARMVMDFVSACQPDEIVTQIGGEGVAFVYHGSEEGDVLMLRAELDALPIADNLPAPHNSCVSGSSHKCGHDGHMAILAGLALRLARNGIRKGKLILLFQPAEETGAGALHVIADPKFQPLIPDYVFALHNLPGLPENSVACKTGPMTIASTGMKISLLGKTTHAMTPEQGISPVEAIKYIHTRIQGLYNSDRSSQDFSLITTVGIQVGAEDYGVAPANGDLLLTVRAYKNEILATLQEEIRTIAEERARADKLQMAISYKESFAASINANSCYASVKNAATANRLPFIEVEQCLGFSEDFGRFIDAARKGGAIFLLGSGTETPGLHTPAYDFNDNIISTGITMFSAIVAEICGWQHPH